IQSCQSIAQPGAVGRDSRNEQNPADKREQIGELEQTFRTHVLPSTLAWTMGVAMAWRSPSTAQGSPVRDDRARGVVAGGAGDPAARMSTRPAVIEPLKRPAIIGVAEHGAGGEQLIERQRAMKDVAAGQPEHLFEVERAQGLAADHAPRETRRIAVD